MKWSPSHTLGMTANTGLTLVGNHIVIVIDSRAVKNEIWEQSQAALVNDFQNAVLRKIDM